MKALNSLVTIACACVIAGCANVYSTGPMGETPFVVKADEWQGTWVHKDGSVDIKVIDATSGRLQVAWIENMKLASHNVQLLQAGERLFGSVEDDGNTNKYLWGLVKKDKNQIVIWTPSVSRFKILVEDHTLPGTVSKDKDVMLGNLTGEHYAVITSETRGILFDWDSPVILIRLAK